MNAKVGTSDRDHLNFGCLTPKNTTEHAQTLMSINSMKYGVLLQLQIFCLKIRGVGQ